MTTQAIEAVAGNNAMSKVFNATVTDGQWDGSTLTDQLSSQQLGIIMPNVTINRLQCRYTSGLCAWRIQNAATLTFQRWGFGVPANTACYDSQAIAPYRINPNDILTTFALPTDDDAGQGNVLAWVQTSKGVELFSGENVQSGISTALTTVVNSQSLGDSMFNSTLGSIMVQVEDGTSLAQLELIDNQGGTVMTLQGGSRGTQGGAMSLEYNLKAHGLAVPIGKGWSLKVKLTGV